MKIRLLRFLNNNLIFIMKTIEERAKEYSDRHKSIENRYFKGYNYYIDEEYDAEKFAYEAGAYDQKTIDDAELLKLKSAWEKQAQINHDAIEKARKWLKEHIYEYIAVGNTDFGKPYDIHLCSEELFDDFPKAMEE